eukprot:203431_1
MAHVFKNKDQCSMPHQIALQCPAINRIKIILHEFNHKDQHENEYTLMDKLAPIFINNHLIGDIDYLTLHNNRLSGYIPTDFKDKPTNPNINYISSGVIRQYTRMYPPVHHSQSFRCNWFHLCISNNNILPTHHADLSLHVLPLSLYCLWES